MAEIAKFTLTNESALDKPVSLAVETAMLFIMEQARFDAPVDTGNLANSIIPDGPYMEGKTAYGYVGTNVFYAPFVEFGTYKMGARPFLGRALENARRKYG
jgi:HK97 gp10 family phage protein